jgi:hypothetical protein
MIKLRMMRRKGHVARMGEVSSSYKILVRQSEGKIHLGLDGRIILK